jgi:hypothetical protein
MLGTAMPYAIEIGGQVPTMHIDHIYQQVILHIKDIKGDTREPQAGSRKRGRKTGKGRKAGKRYIYARTQDLFQNNPGKLAKCVRDNVTWYGDANTDLKERVKSFFQDIWGTKEDIQEALSGEPIAEEIALNDLIPQISTTEIRTRIGNLKKDTAARPDGVLRKHIENPDIQETLRLLFCLLTACGKQPSAWKENRTILIPKEGKDPSIVGNHRPITIGSLLSRLYWGIIDQKMKTDFFFSQAKGFHQRGRLL